MTRFRSYSSKISSNLKKNPALAIGTGAAFTGFTYLLFAQKPEPKVIKERKLPPVAQLIPFPIVEKIILQNEYSIKEAPGIHRMDINSVASNDPGEDYHSEHSVNKASIVGIFDGHGGPECGALVAKYIGTYVNRYVNSPQSGKISKKHHIMAALEKAFIQLDYDIIHGCLPDFNHQNSWNPFKISHDYMTIVKALKSAKSGSCALVAYVEGKDVYIASIGDCRAVLGRKYGDSFKSIDLTEDQTGRTPSEFSRLCEEHPGEDATVIVRGRVLGGLMPTRSFGDARYKWPVSLQTTFIPHIYTNSIFYIYHRS
jgi:pyruvate dehydrogenase phosphatase